MNKSFIKFQLTSKKYLIIFLFVVQFLTCLVAFAFTSFSFFNKGILSYGLSFATLMVAIISLTPLFFNFLHNKKSIDTYYSLPMSRKSLFFNTVIFLIAILFASWIVPNFLTFLLIAGEFGAFLPALLGFLEYVLMIIMIIAGLVFFYATIYLVANNSLDGIVMMVAYILLPLFLAIGVYIFGDIFVCGYQPFSLDIFGFLSMPFMACNMFFESLDFLTVSRYYTNTFFVARYLDMLIFFISTVGFGALLYHTFVSRKAENVEQNSDSFFAYPSLIYFYTFILLFILTSRVTFNYYYSSSTTTLFSSAIAYLFVFIFFAVAHFVYRRKIYINIRMIAFFALSIVLVSGFSTLAYQTRGFGFSDSYTRNHENVIFAFNTVSDAVEDRELVDHLIEELKPIVEEYYGDYNYDYLNLSIEIEMDKEDIQNNPKLYEMIDDHRRLMIDSYYGNDSTNDVSGVNGLWASMNVYEKDNKGNTEKYYYYYTNSFYLEKEFSDELLNYDKIRIIADGYDIEIAD